jgi:membrane protein implicated in regulation of membrane protease activity
MDAYQWTLIAALVLGMAELLTGSFVLLGLAVGALAAGLVQWLAGGVSLNRDLRDCQYFCV